MPTISFIQPKGGAGKSTAALVLASTFAREPKAKIAVLDCDPNRPIAKWRERGGGLSNLTVRALQPNEDFMEVVEDLEKQHLFVIIDTEGSRNDIAQMAAGVSHFVIIPAQSSQLDRDSAADAIKVIRQTSKMANRKIPHAVLLTKSSAAIKTKEGRETRAMFERHGVDVFDVELVERTAFKAMFSLSKTLFELDPKAVSGLDNAVINARRYAGEVVKRMKAAMAAKKNASGKAPEGTETKREEEAAA